MTDEETKTYLLAPLSPEEYEKVKVASPEEFREARERAAEDLRRAPRYGRRMPNPGMRYL